MIVEDIQVGKVSMDLTQGRSILRYRSADPQEHEWQSKKNRVAISHSNV